MVKGRRKNTALANYLEILRGIDHSSSGGRLFFFMLKNIAFLFWVPVLLSVPLFVTTRTVMFHRVVVTTY